MQFQVPQFIDTEDKIVGPLSIRQFIYIVVAGGISTILFFSVQMWLWIALSIPLMGLAGALALAKVNGRPFAKFLLATLSFYWKPQTYVWQPEQPHLHKTQEAVKDTVSSGFSVEKFFAGMALKKTWSRVQTGSAPAAEPEPKSKPATERYQIFHKITGEHEAAKRVDYR